MAKSGPKRTDTETLLRRGSPLGKARKRAEKEAARYVESTIDFKAEREAAAKSIENIRYVEAEVDFGDMDNIRIELTSHTMAMDYVITLENGSAADKKEILEAFGLSIPD